MVRLNGEEGFVLMTRQDVRSIREGWEGAGQVKSAETPVGR